MRNPTPINKWKSFETSGIGVGLWPKFLYSLYCCCRTVVWTASRHLKATGASRGRRLDGMTIERLANTPHNLADDIETTTTLRNEYQLVTVVNPDVAAVITEQLANDHYVHVNIHCGTFFGIEKSIKI